MRFITLVFAALAAGPLAAFAAPAPAEDAAQSCPDGAKIHCGSCNGTSCRIGFENYGPHIAPAMRAVALSRVEVAMAPPAGTTTSVVLDTLFAPEKLKLDLIYDLSQRSPPEFLGDWSRGGTEGTE
ncbi:hypothetical protein An16g06570 [Aspergillus niger]|uniref:Uncharacterized protein n=2 Tax=Aspergillus niger TaxID=5061 RepID=A2R8B7_ASPNC|nr:hypothetical protein An16g06570 [Aspergillus niger]CAK46991.1 hypothetical protein An16g06570 [Aspergillus niger]